MNAVSFISNCVAQVHLRTTATHKDLSTQQLLWRLTPVSNNIGFVHWHVGRFEDTRITNTGKSGEDLWVTGNGHKKFGQPVTTPDPRDRMGLRQLAIPSLEPPVEYAEVVHQRTSDYINGLPSEDLDNSPDAAVSEITVSGSLRHLVTHKNHHRGQIDYLCGLQAEAWDLP